jgi:hypothetical protein
VARGRSNTVFSAGFFADEGWDYAVRIALRACQAGNADAGEVRSTGVGLGVLLAVTRIALVVQVTL